MDDVMETETVGLEITEEEFEDEYADSTVVESTPKVFSKVALKRQRKRARDDLERKRKANGEEGALVPETKKPKTVGELLGNAYDESSYYVENGLRKVYPYSFTHTENAKGRWNGEKLIDIIGKEFRSRPIEEYEREIENGTFTINGGTVDKEYMLENKDIMENVVHKHEAPVRADAVRIVYADKDYVVVNKPASMPVNPSEGYRFNSVSVILAKEFDLKNLQTIHYMDKNSSGLLLFGTSLAASKKMREELLSDKVLKEYVCRVEGQFPAGFVVCSEPLETVSKRMGVSRVGPKGKECKTEFQRISFNGKTSVVLCKPEGERFHQIRVHLQYLGYPIANDFVYNNKVFGYLKGKGGATDESVNQVIRNIIGQFNMDSWRVFDGGNERKIRHLCSLSDSPVTENSSLNGSSRFQQNYAARNNRNLQAHRTGNISENHVFQQNLVTSDENCNKCKVGCKDPDPKDLVLYLHALKYSGSGWCYETPMPDWASANYIG